MQELYNESGFIVWFLAGVTVLSMFVNQKVVTTFLLLVLVSMLLVNPNILTKMNPNRKKEGSVFV